MSILGIVVEYNPFHNGHLFHLKKAKELINPDLTIAVMSGNFVQRGEPAIMDNYSRAEIALKAGIDIVVQLPVVYSVQDAGGFALGSIWTLSLLGVTDIVFGSETGNMKLLDVLSDILIEEPTVYVKLLKQHLKTGLSFPNARKAALKDYLKLHLSDFAESIQEIERSNNILGLEYLRAIKQIRSDITPHSIVRTGADYNDPYFKGRFSSATAIRKLIITGQWEKVKQAVPDYSYAIIKRECALKKCPVHLEKMGRFILGLLRRLDREDFKNYYGFTEGLDARFVRCSRQCGEISEFLECVKAKRFTFTRLKRLLMNVILKLSPKLIEQSNKQGPQYIRVLGFNENGRSHLSRIKKKLKVPLLTTPSTWKRVMYKAISGDFEIDQDLFQLQMKRDIMAADIYSLFFDDVKVIKASNEMKRKIIYIRG